MLILALALAMIQTASENAGNGFPGEKSEWHGYTQYTFQVDGRTCYVVLPKAPAPGNPWIWRARFWGHEPQTDLSLLEKGFHAVYCDVAGLFGSPQAVGHWDAFYRFLTEQLHFAPKPALEGMSRGGLIIYNWEPRIRTRWPVFMPTPRSATFEAGRAVWARAPGTRTNGSRA